MSAELIEREMSKRLDRAIDRIMGIEIEAMGGDNLAVVLCSHFDKDDDDDGECDDNGWSQSAITAYAEIKQEIASLFVPVREAITTQAAEIAELRAKLEARNDLPTVAYLAGSADAQDDVAEKIADWLEDTTIAKLIDPDSIAKAIRDGDWRQG